MTQLDSDTLATITRAIEDAPVAYHQGLTASTLRERLHAVDALAGWIGARLAPSPVHHDRQLTLPIDTGLA
ncbi:DUF6771 family protein [Sphingomonas sp.]|uniref:DUF6771 family protein n=1 Tax=Sphingomonas sp. TaxID=28214 RepID=UPI003D6D2F20